MVFWTKFNLYSVKADLSNCISSFLCDVKVLFQRCFNWQIKTKTLFHHMYVWSLCDGRANWMNPWSNRGTKPNGFIC